MPDLLSASSITPATEEEIASLVPTGFIPATEEEIASVAAVGILPATEDEISEEVSQSIRSAKSQDEAIQLALPHFNSPDRINLAIRSLAEKKKTDDARTGIEKVSDVGTAMLNIPGAAVDLFKHIREGVLPSVAQAVADIIDPLTTPAQIRAIYANAGDKMSAESLNRLAEEKKQDLNKRAARSAAEIATATKSTSFQTFEILRNALLNVGDITAKQAALGVVAPGSKLISDIFNLNTPGVTRTDDEYRERAFEDLVAAQSIREAAEGKYTESAAETAAAGFPIRPEQVQGLETVFDVTNLVPGFAGAKAVKTAAKTEIAARSLRSAAAAPKQVGMLRTGVGAGLEAAGKRLVSASDSPVATGLLAGTVAVASGLDPSGVALATILGSSNRSMGIASSALEKGGNKLLRMAGKAKGTVALGPLGAAVELTGQFFDETVREGAKYGLLVSTPFILGQKDEEGAINVATVGAAFGATGAATAKAVSTVANTARSFPLNNFFRDRSADRPDTDYIAPEFTHYSDDHSNVLEAASRSIFDLFSNRDKQNFEALKSLVGAADVNGVTTRIYAVDRQTGDAFVKQAGLGDQLRAGVTIEPGPGQSVRTILINIDAENGIAAGHEVGHAIEMSLPLETRNQLYELVDPNSKKSLVDRDDFEGLRRYYEDKFNRRRNPDGTFTEVPQNERRTFDDAAVVSEYIAENFSAFVNGVPPGKLGTPLPLVDRMRLQLGTMLEKAGARRLTTQGESKLQTKLGIKPSFALAQIFQNYLEAGRLDNLQLPGEPPILIRTPDAPADRATNAPTAPVSTNAPVSTSPLANIREVEAKPVVPGFKKGDPIGEIRDKDGMLIAEEAKVLRKNEDGTYEIEFIDPDTGKRLIATTDEASLVSPISPGKVDPNKTVFPASPVTPQTPFFAATAPTPPTVTPPTAATTVAPKQVENVARPQGSVATPNLRPGAAAKFAAKAPDTLHSQNRKVLEVLMLAPRAEIPAVETDYYAAASPVQSPDAIVRAAQRKAADALEKSGEPNPFRAAFQKLFVPYRWSSYKLDAATNARLYGEGAPRQPGGIYGMSVDKVGQNLDLLRGLAKENSEVAETLSAYGVSQEYLASDALVSDFRTYLNNQAHGYGGDGKKLSLPADTRPGTITAQDANFVPTALPVNKRQLFNLLLNLEQQATRTPGMEFSARFAKQNGIDPLTVGSDEKGRPLTDNNGLRVMLIQLKNGFDPRLFNSAIENLPTENFTSAIKVRPDVALPAADVAITQAGFMPETGSPRRPQGNDETRSVAAQYTQKAGIQAAPHDTYAPVNETTLRRVADFYENAKNEPEKPEVQKAYRALAEETRAQYDDMVANGIKIEPYEGKGEPYANSAAMLADVRDNKHLYFFLTKNAFGEGADAGNNALLEKSGIKINGIDLLYNDLFRAVHDYFGHTAEGFEFGPRGEYNAYLAHSRMFSDEAKPALAAETLAQNAWVNFGPQLRRADGSLPKAGDADFVPIAKRRFADQKNTVVPPELLQAADPQAAFMPEDSQLEGFGESMREKMRAKMAKVEPSGYQEGDKFELPSGKIVEFVSDLLPKKGGARDGAQMAYVRFEDGMESSVYLDDLTKTYGPGGSFMPEAPDTPAFKNWFGDWQDPKAFTSKQKGPVSAVVDWKAGDRRPLRVYHSTTGDFNAFESGRSTFDDMGLFGNVETNRHAVFFSDSPEQANSYAENRAGKPYEGAKTYPAYLDMKSPADFTRWDPWSIAEEAGVNPRWIQNKQTWELFDGKEGKEFVEGLKKAGYDGAIFKEDAVREGVTSGTTFAVFEPTQIKSATGNSGAFDPTNPDIRYMPEVQFDAPKKLPDAIRNKTLTLVHRGAAGVSELDPAKFGSSRITPRSELAGEPRVFFYVKGFENKGDPSQLRGNKYEIPVSGKRIYDADTDALDWTQDANRQRADIMLKDAGYVGLIRTRGEGKNLFKQVEIFEKVSVDGTPVSETDVRTPRNRLETPEGRKVAAQLRKKYGSTGAYFDRLNEYKETGNVRYMPEAPDTPEFKKWFGDSKVVDKNGEPLVVYHGTPEYFTEFNPRTSEAVENGKEGLFFFTDSKKLASDYSKNPETLKRGNVMQTYLDMQRPYEFDAKGENWGRLNVDGTTMSLDELAQEARSAGHDGLIVKNVVDGLHDRDVKATTYVVFEPTQIKSATGNSGAFDPTNPDISFMPEAPSPAVQVLDELKRANFISDKVAKAALGEFPTYLTSVADFITKQREKLVGGNLTSRDVAKAYMMTVASQGTGAIFVDTIAKKLEPLGIAFDPSATFRAEDGKKIRPEEAAAWWLGTADGKRALDNIEQGVVNPEDWAGLAAVRKAYGDDRFKTFRALDPKNLERIADVTSDLNASKGKSSDVLNAVQKLNGISTGKKGFVSHLLGLGDTPTIDAVEINFWLTGKGDIKTLNTKKAELARRVKETQSDARVSGELFRRIDDRIEALRGEVPGSDKVAPEVWAHILHHWLWDKAKGLETTHEGMYKAQGKFMPEAPEMGRNEEFTKIPSDPEVVSALSSDKKDYVGVHRKLAAGTPVGLRIDIPAFTRTGKYVVTVHEKAGSSVGKRIGYDGIATVDEPTFFSNETGAQKIYDGGAKFPVATVEGLFNPSREIPSDISDWTPVGYDPKEHSFFYDKNSGEPVLSGDQAVSVGNTVFVKNPIYGDVADFRFMPEALDPAKVDTLPGEELARGIDIDPTPVNELNDGDAKIDWTAAFMPETIPGVFPLIDQKLLEQIKSETPTIAAMHIDRMRVGSYKGIDLQGGMFYPAIKENVDKGVVWAFNSKGAASRSANRAAQNGGYVKLVLMAEGNIVGNRTFTNVWFNDVREAVASGDLKEKRALVELNRVRRSFASETDHRTKWETLEQAQKDIVDMPQMLRGSTYFQKTKVVTKADGEKVQYGSLLTKALTSVGFPDAVQLVSALEEPAFKGVPQGAAVAVLKFDPIKDRSEIKTAEEVGVLEHASYKYVLKGRPVARLENYSVVDADYPEIRRLIMSQQKKDFPVGRALIPETPAGTINYGLQDATIAPRQAAEAPLAREGVVSLPQRGLANATISPRNK